MKCYGILFTVFTVSELWRENQQNIPFFYGWDLTASRLQSHYEEVVYFLPLISQKFLVLISLTSEGWKNESFNLGATQWFWTRDPWMGNPVPYPLGQCCPNPLITRPLLTATHPYWGSYIYIFFNRSNCFVNFLKTMFFPVVKWFCFGIGNEWKPSFSCSVFIGPFTKWTVSKIEAIKQIIRLIWRGKYDNVKQ